MTESGTIHELIIQITCESVTIQYMDGTLCLYDLLFYWQSSLIYSNNSIIKYHRLSYFYSYIFKAMNIVELYKFSR